MFFAQPFIQNLISKSAFWWTEFAVLAAGAVFLVIRSMQLSPNLRPRLIAMAVALLIIVPAFAAARQLATDTFQWAPYSDAALASAEASGKPVLIDFTATWCTNCHYLEAVVLPNKRVVDLVREKDVVMLKGDITSAGTPAGSLLRKLNPADSIPVTAVYFPNQQQPHVLNGLYTADDLVHTLNGIQ